MDARKVSLAFAMVLLLVPISHPVAEDEASNQCEIAQELLSI